MATSTVIRACANDVIVLIGSYRCIIPNSPVARCMTFFACRTYSMAATVQRSLLCALTPVVARVHALLMDAQRVPERVSEIYSINDALEYANGSKVWWSGR